MRPQSAARGAQLPRMRAIQFSGQGGQGLVEFAFVVPVFLLLLLGMLEFGLAFTHDQTLSYATREGARTGAAMGDGSTSYPCNASTVAAFDAPVIAAVERVLNSPGSPIDLTKVSSISVYLAKSDGTPTTGQVNIWTPAPGAGPTVDNKALDFQQTTVGWNCLAPRYNSPHLVGSTTVGPDAIGVSVSYTYSFQTSLGGLFKFMFGSSWSSLSMTDKTVMDLNPTNG